MKSATTTTTTHTALPARQYLRLASAKLKPLAQASGKTVNELLTAEYSYRAHAREWDTFRGWKSRGYYVAKGERGFAVWSRPISAAEAAEAAAEATATDATDAATDADTPTREAFYVAYIFCAAQVKDREGYTPDGKEYTPTNLTPPHYNLADTATATTTSATTKPQPATAATPATATAHHAQPAAPAVKYVQQLALAI